MKFNKKENPIKTIQQKMEYTESDLKSEKKLLKILPLIEEDGYKLYKTESNTSMFPMLDLTIGIYYTYDLRKILEEYRQKAGIKEEINRNDMIIAEYSLPEIKSTVPYFHNKYMNIDNSLFKFHDKEGDGE